MEREAGIVALVESGTDAELPATPEETVAQVKRWVRGDDATTQIIFGILMERLRVQHAQVRLLVVAMMDTLFMRSSSFRKLMASSFQDFLNHSVGYDKDCPLPGPANRAEALRERTLEVVEKWSEKFGKTYKQIDVGHRYLKDALKFKFPEVGARTAQMLAEQAAREERARRLLRAKYQQIVEGHSSFFPECEATTQQLNEVLDIVEEQKKAGMQKYEGEDVEWELDDEQDTKESLNRCDSVKTGDSGGTCCEEQMGLSAYVCDDIPTELFGINDTEAVGEEQSDPFESVDAAVVENLRGLVKGAFDRLLPVVQEWLRVLIRVEVGALGSFENTRREGLLREAIARKSALIGCQDRLSQLGLPTDTSLYTERKSEKEKMATGGSQPRKKKQKKKMSKRKPGKGRKRKEREIVDPCAPKAGMPFAIQNFTEPLVSDNQPTSTEGMSQQAKPENAAFCIDKLPSSNTPLTEELRASLLRQAPRLTNAEKSSFQSGGSAPKPLPSSGTELYNHWGRVDYDEMVASKNMLDLTSIQASYFTPDEIPKRTGDGRGVSSSQQKNRRRQSEIDQKSMQEDLGAATRKGLSLKEREKAIREEDRRHNAAVLGLSDERIAREAAEGGAVQPRKKKKNAKVEKLKKFLFRK